MSETRTTCPYCGVGCGLIVGPGGRVRGDPDHPANRGRICSKGAALAETIGPEDRLLAPRVNRRSTGWDQALDLVATRFSEAIRAHGPNSVAFYVSGQMLTEDYYVANKLMKGFVGSANIDSNSRLCMASAVAGHRRAFGSDTVPGTYEDLELADLVVLVGSNLAWCHPVLFQRLAAARAARPGMKLVVIDPRRTASCEGADLHLAVAPDGELALFNALLAEIDRRGAVRRDHVARHVDGFDAALRAARACDPEASGLDAGERARLFDMWICTERVVTIWSQGVNQSRCGSDKVNAIINCHLATGRIGRPGMGPFSVTGQPNAMGGREVGAMANMLACHLDIENPAHRDTVQRHWRAPTICTRPGLKAAELFEACDAGRIKALWIIGTNPAVSLPDADFVTRAIARVPFTVVSDITDTDTTALAHVLLPAAGWGEKSGTVTNSERRISRQRAFMPAPGQARPDWRIICDVAARMGWKEAFCYDSPAAIFREHAALSGKAAALGRDFDISGLAGIGDDEYDALAPVQWPVPAQGRAGGRFFAAGGYFHEGARARMLPVTAPARQAQDAEGAAGLRLNTGRIRDQWHTMTRTGRAPRLSLHQSEPRAEIHPSDAARLGIEDGALVEIVSPRGHAVLRAGIEPGAARGAIFAPMHWSARHASQGRINATLQVARDPISGQPALKSARVALRPFVVRWHALAFSSRQMRPEQDYAAIMRSQTGWMGSLAGQDRPSDWESLARRVLNLPGGTASILLDEGRCIVRLAIHDGAVLRGLFFAAPQPPRLPRAQLAGLIGQEVPALAALAGSPPGRHPDPGPVICACRGVGANTIAAAIAAGARDIATLGQRTGAGSGCGACRPELRSMLMPPPRPPPPNRPYRTGP